MRVVLALLAFVGFIIGLSIMGTAKGAIHEMLGTLMIGFSLLLVGLTAILHELVKFNTRMNPKPSA